MCVPDIHRARQFRWDKRLRYRVWSFGSRHRRKLLWCELRRRPRSAGGYGTVFEVTPAGVITSLHKFQKTDGRFPTGLVLAADENFYGATAGGGSHDRGTLFKVTSAETFTSLFSFGNTSGYPIYGTLVQGPDGAFYGTALDGGANGDGTVFKGNPNIPSGKVIHDFDLTDGLNPWFGLTLAADGTFYGTSPFGRQNNDNCNVSGGPGCGTIFKVSSNGSFTTVHEFDGSDGAGPFSPLVQASDGNFYGTTSQGVTPPINYGSIFQMSPTGILTTFHNFDGADGSSPLAGMIQATDKNLYGTTWVGGTNDGGTIFRSDLEGNFSVVYNFCDQANCVDGGGGIPTLVQGTDGKLYGLTRFGGVHDDGVVFTLDLGLGPFVRVVGNYGRVGQIRSILGQGFSGTSSVSFNGLAAEFKVVSDTLIHAKVPTGATSGFVSVVTPSGALTSNVPFNVLP